MKVYFDTSVLVAAVVEDHPQHGPASDVLLAARGKRSRGFISAHSLAEFYSVLTRTPFEPRIHPSEAWQMLEQDILAYVDVTALTAVEYRQVIRECVGKGWTGGVVYDALHMRCAQKAGCERLYTLNLRDFRLLAPEGFRERVCSP